MSKSLFLFESGIKNKKGVGSYGQYLKVSSNHTHLSCYPLQLRQGGFQMLKISVEELEQNLDKYIDLSKEEDIIVYDGDIIRTILTSPLPREKDTKSFLSLMGTIEYFDYESYLRERDENR